jgi:hypothetical protein
MDNRPSFSRSLVAPLAFPFLLHPRHFCFVFAVLAAWHGSALLLAELEFAIVKAPDSHGIVTFRFAKRASGSLPIPINLHCRTSIAHYNFTISIIIDWRFFLHFSVDIMVAIKRAALLTGLAQLISLSAAQDAITDDSHFYGQSPPVYPSRK